MALLVNRLSADRPHRIVSAVLVALIMLAQVGARQAVLWLVLVFVNESIEIVLSGRLLKAPNSSPLAARGLTANLAFGGAVWALATLIFVAEADLANTLLGVALVVGSLVHLTFNYINYPRALPFAAPPLVLAASVTPIWLYVVGVVDLKSALLVFASFMVVVYYLVAATLHNLRTDRALRAALERADAATNAKSAFLANMSHEIRTPLNGVLGVAQALEQTSLDARQREMVELVRDSGATLDRLLSDILDLSKIDAGEFDLAVDVFDLRQTVEAAAYLLGVRADEKGVAFSVTFSDAACGLFIGDGVRLRQVVANLASNAVKFTAKGQVTINVDVLNQDELESAGDGPVLRIVVSDTGVGFDAETAARLFGRFEQASVGVSGAYGGTGLGLSICRGLAELMGGQIWAQSEVGVGSVFTFQTPIRRHVQPTEETTDTTDTAFLNDAAALCGLRILLAEDNVMNQRVVTLMLEPFSMTIVIAQHGEEAVAHADADAFDIILMDMQMPGCNGLEASRRIRAREAETGRARTPIAMLSANAMHSDVTQALEAGCDVHIAKPVSPEGLLRGLIAARAACAALRKAG